MSSRSTSPSPADELDVKPVLATPTKAGKGAKAKADGGGRKRKSPNNKQATSDDDDNSGDSGSASPPKRVKSEDEDHKPAGKPGKGGKAQGGGAVSGDQRAEVLEEIITAGMTALGSAKLAEKVVYHPSIDRQRG